MPTFGNEPQVGGRARDIALTSVVVLVALGMPYLPPTTQERVSAALQVSALRPFLGVQALLGNAGARRIEVDVLQATVDSLSSAMSTHRAVAAENDALRSLLGLQERAGPAFQPAVVSRPGTPGSESTFIVSVGSGDGVRAGAPVISPQGMVGIIREVRKSNAIGIDWTHPDFRASAMLADGSAYGLVESRRGSFREEDRLVLNGVPYHEEVPSGQTVLTSGLGGIFPRGIPIGTVLGVAEEEGTWRKAYFLTPVAAPAGATHVLVLSAEVADDVNRLWPPDSVTGSDDRIDER